MTIFYCEGWLMHGCCINHALQTEKYVNVWDVKCWSFAKKKSDVSWQKLGRKIIYRLTDVDNRQFYNISLKEIKRNSLNYLIFTLLCTLKYCSFHARYDLKCCTNHSPRWLLFSISSLRLGYKIWPNILKTKFIWWQMMKLLFKMFSVKPTHRPTGQKMLQY